MTPTTWRLVVPVVAWAVSASSILIGCGPERAPPTDVKPTGPSAGPPAYRLRLVDAGVIRGDNPALGVRVAVSRGTLSLAPWTGTWHLDLRWNGVGRGEQFEAVDPPEGGFELTGNRASFARKDGSEEWFSNGPSGVEHGVLFSRPPTVSQGASRPLALYYAVEGSLTPRLGRDGSSVQLRSRTGRVVARYAGLHAYAADGARLPAWLEVEGRSIRLVVDDRDARYPIVIDPLVWLEHQKLIPNDLGSDDALGDAVSIEGNTAVIGAPGDSDTAQFSGSAYVYVRSNGVWSEQQELKAGDAESNDLLGVSVCASGDTAILGAPGDDDAGAASGSAYVFVRGGTAWSEQQKLTASLAAPLDFFGEAVSIASDTAVVGAHGDDGAALDAGAAYVFVRAAGVWAEQQRILASDASAGSSFGAAVDVEGDTVLIGAYGAGAAYVMVRSGSVWTEQQKLTPSDAGPGAGSAVSLQADTAVVGADSANAAYVFVRSGGVWNEQQKLTGSDTLPGDDFGAAVAMDGDTVIVGARSANQGMGAAYVFARSGNVWNEQSKFVANVVQGADLGDAVSISGDEVLVGAPFDGDAGGDSGAAFVLRYALPDGDPCATDGECHSRQCSDGVCCDAPCTGQCEACDVADALGSCVPVFGPPHGDRTPCSGGAPVAPCEGGSCNGEERTLCAGFAGPETSCRQESCADGVMTLEAACDTELGCPPAETLSCAPHVCGDTSCKEACESTGDCSEGICDEKTGQCANVSTCDDGRTIVAPDGAMEDCAPFRCNVDPVECRSTCASSDDCVRGAVCNVDGVCAVDPAEDDGGCGCRIHAGARRDREGDGRVPRLPSLMFAVSALALAARLRRPGTRHRSQRERRWPTDS